jgi:hypothetical protein
MSTRGARVLRGLIVALVALLVAAVAHIAGGGQIGAVGFSLAFAFSALASIALAGRSVSRIRVAIAVLFSQGIFHLLFGIGADHKIATLPSSSGMLMSGMGDPGAAAGLAHTLPASYPSMPDNGWMWVAHGLAAMLTIVALVKGERTFWMLADWVFHTISRTTAISVPVAATRPAAPEAVPDISAADAHFLRAGMRHRGPPQLVASM